MSVSNKHTVVAKEGWPFLALCLVLSVLAFGFIHFSVSLLFIFAFIFLLYLYRDPIRSIPPSPLGVVSPVDGKIVSIEEVISENSNEKTQKISIELNRFGVFSARSPIEGKLIKQWQKLDNGHLFYINWIQTDEGDNIIWEVVLNGKQKASCYVQPGERLGQGQRYGFLPFSSKIQIYIPFDSQINVKVGQNVIAGEDILSFIVHKNAASLVGDATLVAANTNEPV